MTEKKGEKMYTVSQCEREKEKGDEGTKRGKRQKYSTETGGKNFKTASVMSRKKMLFKLRKAWNHVDLQRKYIIV